MYKLFTLFAAFLLSVSLAAQKKKDAPKDENAIDLSGLTFRSIGPAVTSGRIADFAVNPDQPKEYYVATASGGVWKTQNAGTTFTSIFDSQGSYSIGCITMSPHHAQEIWVGTGENNNQRSVGYGDGIYKSVDGGASWQHMGLKDSEHISNIIVHPADPMTVYVAAVGPLWRSGGERGVYKTTDGGKTWELALGLDEHTGVTDLVMDPRDPDVLYASAFQRRRHVFTYVGGGPGSGLHRTTDGGQTWSEINKGLPDVDLGRIGLAVSPADPDILYAIVEAAQGKSGFYRSTNRGASWHKQGGYSTSGNYYQEIVADPVDPDKVYAMDTWMHVSVDGGKTFSHVGEDYKHVDNHCLWIDPDDTDHLLAGCDGGIYETYDGAATWHYKANLPITQFYKVAVDNAEPFYFIYGGTQDNFSMGGPSRTTSGNGISNDEWFMTHGGDGFESAVDPDNPNIVYAQSQYGYLVRYDKLSGEELGIKPVPGDGEHAYRWNWDAPLEVSAHVPGRIYFAANKVFRSDDRGNSWDVISDDLTSQIDRNALKVMDRIQSTDAVAKNRSTSPYGTIVAFSESTIDVDLLYVGTDDGLIQVSEDGGDNWRRQASFAGVPDGTYVNKVLASKHDQNVVYAAFNRHKEGDFKPYLMKSTDRGRSWSSISGDLPVRGSVYAFEEDHVDADLLFAGTEFGVFVSTDGGGKWTQLKGGLPTVAVRDIALQQREHDLVLGTFGRGFYVLDDYAVLREVAELEDQQAALLPVRDALAFEMRYPLGLPKQSFQGDSYYLGDNLGAEAIMTYFMKEKLTTRRAARREREKETVDDTYPTYEDYKAEAMEEDPYLLFTIKDEAGDVVRKLKATPGEGLQRIHWDLRYASTNPVSLSKPSFYNPFGGQDEGTLVPPGTYTVSLSSFVDGKMTALAEPVRFEVRGLDGYALPAADRQAVAAFQDEVSEVARVVRGAQRSLNEIKEEMKHIKAAIDLSPTDQEVLVRSASAIMRQVDDLHTQLNGDDVASKLDIGRPMSVSERLGLIEYEMFHSTSAPTETHRESLTTAKKNFEPLRRQLRQLITEDLAQLQSDLEAAGAPYTPRRVMVE